MPNSQGHTEFIQGQDKRAIEASMRWMKAQMETCRLVECMLFDVNLDRFEKYKNLIFVHSVAFHSFYSPLGKITFNVCQ